MGNILGDIYRGFTVYRKDDGLWRWTDPNGVAACADTFKTEADAQNDIDRFKREQHQQKS